MTAAFLGLRVIALPICSLPETGKIVKSFTR